MHYGDCGAESHIREPRTDDLPASRGDRLPRDVLENRIDRVLVGQGNRSKPEQRIKRFEHVRGFGQCLEVKIGYAGPENAHRSSGGRRQPHRPLADQGERGSPTHPLERSRHIHQPRPRFDIAAEKGQMRDRMVECVILPEHTVLLEAAGRHFSRR